MTSFLRRYDWPDGFDDVIRRSPHVRFFSHGLLPDPSAGFQAPLNEHDVTWKLLGTSQASFGHEAFGDGSGLNGR